MADQEVYASDADLHYTGFWDDYTYKASKPHKRGKYISKFVLLNKR
jgi:hypothetical protein